MPQNLNHCTLCFSGSWLIIITRNLYLQKEKGNLTFKSKYQINGPVKKQTNHLNLLPASTSYFIAALWDLNDWKAVSLWIISNWENAEKEMEIRYWKAHSDSGKTGRPLLQITQTSTKTYTGKTTHGLNNFFKVSFFTILEFCFWKLY